MKFASQLKRHEAGSKEHREQAAALRLGRLQDQDTEAIGMLEDDTKLQNGFSAGYTFSLVDTKTLIEFLKVFYMIIFYTVMHYA